MRLIDADELKLSLCKECTLYPNQCLKDKCDWNSIYHIDHAKTIEAIPIDFLIKTQEEYCKRYGEVYKAVVLNLLEDWRKDNETD